jgi:3-deoxy-D-manno-octulosonic-acid transferase
LLLREGDIQTWQPWDTPGAVDRFLSHFKPRMGILMETEVWPNLVAACVQHATPLVLANARMSEKSRLQAQRLGWLSRPAFGALTCVWAQTQADAQRLRQLGASVQGVFGNIKFDAKPDTVQVHQGQQWRSRATLPIVMFASSREGEEAALIQLLTSWKTPDVAIQWLIVPRHPQRFEEVAAMIVLHGFSVSRRSEWRDEPPECQRAVDAQQPTIWLGDSLGEMSLYYGLANAALLGGSFEPLGGQNLIEAAACGCPVVMGPHTFNFAEAAELAQATGAALRASSLEMALEKIQALVNDAQAVSQMSTAATEFSGQHCGAVEKTATAIAQLLGE